MPNQVPGDIKEQRSKELIELSDKDELEYNKFYVGKKVEVLWEETKNGVIKGHTQNYIEVIADIPNIDNITNLNKDSVKLENEIKESTCIGVYKNEIKVEL